MSLAYVRYLAESTLLNRNNVMTLKGPKRPLKLIYFFVFGSKNWGWCDPLCLHPSRLHSGSSIYHPRISVGEIGTLRLSAHPYYLGEYLDWPSTDYNYGALIKVSEDTKSDLLIKGRFLFYAWKLGETGLNTT